ncbi:unnamed protein product [Caenorhabditis brenneri]
MKGQKLLRRQPDFLQLITPTFIQIAVVDKTFFVESTPCFCLNEVQHRGTVISRAEHTGAEHTPTFIQNPEVDKTIFVGTTRVFV